MKIAAIAPTVSATSPAVTAYLVLRMPTDPKYSATM